MTGSRLPRLRSDHRSRQYLLHAAAGPARLGLFDPLENPFLKLRVSHAGGEGPHHGGVVGRARALDDLLKDILNGPRSPVGTQGGGGVERLGDGQDAGAQGDGVTANSSDSSSAVSGRTRPGWRQKRQSKPNSFPASKGRPMNPSTPSSRAAGRVKGNWRAAAGMLITRPGLMSNPTLAGSESTRRTKGRDRPWLKHRTRSAWSGRPMTRKAEASAMRRPCACCGRWRWTTPRAITWASPVPPGR